MVVPIGVHLQHHPILYPKVSPRPPKHHLVCRVLSLRLPIQLNPLLQNHVVNVALRQLDCATIDAVGDVTGYLYFNGRTHETNLSSSSGTTSSFLNRNLSSGVPKLVAILSFASDI